jgi:hypothetical protein
MYELVIKRKTAESLLTLSGVHIVRGVL